MSEDYVVQLELLRDQAEALPEGRTKVALLQSAIELADAHQDLNWGFELRLDFVTACFCSAMGEPLIVAVTWCLAQADRDPDTFSNPRLLWQCKHVLSFIAGFPTISRQQIDSVTADVVRRYTAQGVSQRPIFYFRCANALLMGDFKLATEYRDAAVLLPTDWYSEGADWELYFQLKYLMEAGRDDDFLIQADPFLEWRRGYADVAPWGVMLALPALLRKGDWERARICHERAYAAVKRQPRLNIHAAEHMLFQFLRGDRARALQIFETHLPWATDIFSPYYRFVFAVRVWVVFESLARGGQSSIELRLPREHPLHHAAGPYATADIAAFYAAETRQLADQFNARNGNAYFDRLIDRVWALTKLPGPLA